MLSASTSMPCSSMALMRSVPMTRDSGFTFRPINAIASGKAQCACTSTVFTRRPFTTTSRRLGAGCACVCVVCISSQPTKATPAMAPVMPPMKSLRVVISSSPCRIVFRRSISLPYASGKGVSRDRSLRRRWEEVASCRRSVDGGVRYAADAKCRQGLARCRHRAVDVDAATRILDHHDVEAFPMRVLGGVADAEVEREPGEEEPPQAALSKVSGEPGLRSAIVLVECRVGIDLAVKALAQHKFRMGDLQLWAQFGARRSLHAMVRP